MKKRRIKVMSEDLAAIYAVYEVAIAALVEHEKRGYERDELNDKMCDQWDRIKKIWRGEIEFDDEKDKHEAMKAAWEEMIYTRSAFRTAHEIVKEAEKKVDPLIHEAYMQTEKHMKVLKLHLRYSTPDRLKGMNGNW
jgi:hypothetical protein